MAYRTAKIETPKYKVIQQFDDFEVRQYGSMVLAQTKIKNDSYEKSSRNGFQTVAGYIFGGNDENKKIAMTAPVIMDLGEDTKMSFVMPKQHSLESLPEPNSDDVELLKVPPKQFAVLTFSGYANDSKITKYSKKLIKSIRAEGIQSKGNVQFMGYNAPWQVFGRKNEVAIELVPEI
jgi:hypothetical protein